ncbi:PKD domain-containing protein [Halorubrum sp. Atlit-28R]|uniref:PKD domain-containing protein n=1 Tax=Halorubrum sp. Atlit-28R TaxID=2282129 RepID=UPI001314A925|nr:PKD domain-containing protein [Halorubrum sp. Atlit-28R]
MTGFNSTRRSVLTTLAGMGLLGGTVSGEVANETDHTSTTNSLSQTPTERRVLGVELIHHNTGERFIYSSYTDVEKEELPDGGYNIIEATEEDGEIVRRTSSVHISQGVQATVDDGTELRVLVHVPTEHDYVPTTGSIDIWAGAVQRQNGRDTGFVSDQDITVRVESSGTTIATKSVTTDQSGSATATIDLSGVEPGRYRVLAEATGLNTPADSFEVGTYTDMPFHWTGLTPGEETTLGIYSAQGLEPEAGVSRSITVEEPDGTVRDFDVQIEEGGIGFLDYTPTSSGEYRFRSDSDYMSSLESGELKAITPYFEIRNQYVNDTVTWSAFILQDREPVSNLDIDVTITEERDSIVIEEFSTTTNEFGQFSISFEAPAESGTEYEIDIQATDGRSVFLFGDRIDFRSPPQPPAPEPIELDIDVEDYVIGLGSETNVAIEFTDGDQPLSDKDISLQYYYSFNDVPVGSESLTTNADGEASTVLSIPETAPDGERIYVRARAQADGTTYTDEDSLSIEQFNYDFEAYGLDPGVNNSIDISVTDRSTGDPVSDVDVTMFGNRYHVDAETFDAGYTQTGSDGTGTIDLTIPSDATNDIMINQITRYSDANNSRGQLNPPFTADISLPSVDPKPGDSFSISYSTDYTEPVSAIVAFPGRENAATTLLAENETKTLSVPASVAPGDYLDVELLMISADGEAAVSRDSLQVAEGLTAGFEYDPSEPAPGEMITFTDTSTVGPNATITSREWDFSGDGSTDSTGDTASHTFDEAGLYDVSLTVTDGADNTDTATQTVSVSSQTAIPPVVGDSPPQDLNGDGLYRDIDGDGEVDIFDVQALYNNLDSDVVQNNPAAFSFSSGSANGEVDIFDVQALYNDMQNQ